MMSLISCSSNQDIEYVKIPPPGGLTIQFSHPTISEKTYRGLVHLVNNYKLTLNSCNKSLELIEIFYEDDNENSANRD